jgi:hypothetical protein
MSQAQIHDRHQSAPVGARRRRNLTSPLGPIGGARTLARMVGRAAILQAYEVGLMASLAATVPLHLAGDRFGPAVGAPVHAHTAPTARPMLLVHGLGGTSQAGPSSREPSLPEV